MQTMRNMVLQPDLCHWSFAEVRSIQHLRSHHGVAECTTKCCVIACSMQCIVPPPKEKKER